MRASHLSLLALLALVPVAGSQSAFAADAVPAVQNLHEGRVAFAKDFAQKVLAIIQDPKKKYADRKDVLRTAFSNSVDIDWIARFVLGAKWNAATPDQKTRYMTLYRKYLTETYVANFAENPDKRIRDIKIFGINEANDSDFNVRTEMQLADSEKLKVSYLVNENDGHYKVRDIAIENVSLITTHRSQFTNLAASRGVEGVIAKLEQLTSETTMASVAH